MAVGTLVGGPLAGGGTKELSAGSWKDSKPYSGWWVCMCAVKI